MRKITHVVNVGGVKVGGNNPIVVQSMTDTDTSDINKTVNQIEELYNAGSEIVRVTVNNVESIAVVPTILRRGENWFSKLGKENNVEWVVHRSVFQLNNKNDINQLVDNILKFSEWKKA